MSLKTQGTNISGSAPLIKPKDLWNEFPLTESVKKTVAEGREEIQRILDRKDKRRFIIVGPCSIHDPEQALEYAARLKKLSEKVKDKLVLVMRVYFEKPRTTVGWKGLINDPDLNGSFQVEKGLRIARKLLIDISDLGVISASETLDPITPKYLAGIISWAAIGARTTESQTHRELASGLSMPVGFKNGTDGNVDTAVNAMKSASHPHSFIGVNDDGEVSVLRTKGNPYGHIILRGGGGRPNYDATSVETIRQRLEKAGVPQNIMIDCSHANANKDHKLQPAVFKNVIQQIADGNENIVGLMLESNLCEGNQPMQENLKYGVSITDKCMSWETTESLILEAHDLIPV